MARKPKKKGKGGRRKAESAKALEVLLRDTVRICRLIVTKIDVGSRSLRYQILEKCNSVLEQLAKRDRGPAILSARFSDLEKPSRKPARRAEPVAPRRHGSNKPDHKETTCCRQAERSRPGRAASPARGAFSHHREH